ncbi:MAG: hypothetical protein WD603_01720 [Patescibacteria group bacterium]
MEALPDAEASGLSKRLERCLEGHPHVVLKLDDMEHGIQALRDDEGDDEITMDIMRGQGGFEGIELRIRQELGSLGGAPEDTKYEKEHIVFLGYGGHTIDSDIHPIRDSGDGDDRDVREDLDAEVAALKFKIEQGLSGRPLLRAEADDIDFLLRHGRKVSPK